MELAKVSPGIALAGLLSVLFYKVAMRVLDVLDRNTKALTVIEMLLTNDRRRESR